MGRSVPIRTQSVGKLARLNAEALIQTTRTRIDAHLDRLLPAASEDPSLLHQAMRYSALAPGKRIRPALCLASARAFGNDELALNAAAALEMVHVFSLIHDDLPAIDNDDLRRGRPTCHVQYGEAIAILAGDALFALAFESLSDTDAEPSRVLRAMRALAAASGSNGLVGGEVADVLSEGKEVDQATLELIHVRKTGALIAASCEIGALIGGGSDEEVEAFRAFGMDVGLAFQITDDVLNEVGDAEALGKAVGSDRDRAKATYPALYGLDASRQAAKDTLDRAIGRLVPLAVDRTELEALARYAVDRVT